MLWVSIFGWSQIINLNQQSTTASEHVYTVNKWLLLSAAIAEKGNRLASLQRTAGASHVPQHLPFLKKVLKKVTIKLSIHFEMLVCTTYCSKMLDSIVLSYLDLAGVFVRATFMTFQSCMLVLKIIRHTHIPLHIHLHPTPQHTHTSLKHNANCIFSKVSSWV